MGKNEETAEDGKYSGPKKKSRKGLEEKYGKRFEINLHEDSQGRLLKIANWLDGDDYSTLKKGRGNVYRQALDDVINMVYIDYLYEPVSKEAKLLKELYLEFHELKEKQESKENRKLKGIMLKLCKKYPSPVDIAKKRTAVTGKDWSEKETEKLKDFRWVIQTMEKLDSVQLPVSTTK
ncbi:hypothetical protein WHZ76_05075 [Citrobacter portucalensis]|uniref:hypothetical protein n=1 Tax=Citrobacter portucalensis TaxID=1639133 RepID=UPI00339C430E